MTVLNRLLLEKLYVELGKTDKEIANFFEVDRTAIVHARKDYSIKTRETIGRKAELIVLEKLKTLGHVKDMNKVDNLHGYDILFNKKIRIDVKSSNEHKNRFAFSLSEKAANENIISETRIRLNNGRTKKLFHKTCDYLIFVGFSLSGKERIWIIPSDKIPVKRGTIYISRTDLSKDKYGPYEDNWEQLKAR